MNEFSSGRESCKLDLNRNDEFMIIEKSYNSMTTKLSQTIDSFEKLNTELENKVNDRTVDLKNAYEALKESNVKNQKLLSNILPGPIAKRLINNPQKQIADDYAQVSVLFTDFKGFTPFSESVTPEKLVSELNEIFATFDDLALNYNMEKIKTIGDSYMAAGGVPNKNDTHPIDAVNFGLELLKFVEERNKNSNKAKFQIRVGIHSGPVVAGVIGKSKFSFDLWGDTVNIASRMESSGIPGRVTISETTYKLVKSKFECRARGELEVKGKGIMKIYDIG